MSVAVTQSKPPSPTACTAPSRSVDGVPYGSRSTTSNIFSCCIMSIRTSWPAHTTFAIRDDASEECAALNATLRLMAATALGSKSFATTHPNSSSSRAYRIARRPLAAMPSRILSGLSGGFGRGSGAFVRFVSFASGSASLAAAEDPAGASSAAFRVSASRSSWVLYISSISSGERRWGRMGLSLGVAHRLPLLRLFFGARRSVSCSAARRAWNWRITARLKSRFTTWALL